MGDSLHFSRTFGVTNMFQLQTQEIYSSRYSACVGMFGMFHLDNAG